MQIKFIAVLAAAVTGSVFGAVGSDVWRTFPSEDGTAVIVTHEQPERGQMNVVCRWTAQKDGVPLATGCFPLEAPRTLRQIKDKVVLGPQRVYTNALPAVLREAGAKYGEYALRVLVARVDPADDAKREILAATQLDMPRPKRVPVIASPKDVEVEENGDRLVFKAERTEYVFSKRSGQLLQVRTGSWFMTDWLAAPTTFVLLPEGAGDAKSRALGLGEPSPVTVEVSSVTNAEGSASRTFMTRARWTGTPRPDTAYPFVANDLTFEVVTRWTIRGDGTAVCRMGVRRDGPPAGGIRPGLRFTLAADEPLVEYFGLGRDPQLGDAQAQPWLGRWTADLVRSPLVLADARALSLDVGWEHLSFAGVGIPLYLVARSEKGAKRQTVDVCAMRAKDGDAAFVFTVEPTKRLAMWASAPKTIPDAFTPPRSAYAKRRVFDADGTGAENLYDGDGATCWRATRTDGMPTVTLDLGETVRARGVRLLQPQEAALGRVKGFLVETSADGKRWSPEVVGDLADDPVLQRADFKEPVSVRYLRVTVRNTWNESKAAALAEIQVVTE